MSPTDLQNTADEKTNIKPNAPNIPRHHRLRKLISTAFTTAIDSIFRTQLSTRRKTPKLEGAKFYRKLRETQLAHDITSGVEVSVMSGTITETHPEGLQITNNPIFQAKADIIGDSNPLTFPHNYWFYSVSAASDGMIVLHEIDPGLSKLPVKVSGSGHTSGGFVSWKGVVVPKSDGKYALDITKDHPEVSIDEAMPDVGYYYFLDSTK